MNFNLIKQAINSKRTQWLMFTGVGLIFLVMYIAIFPSLQNQSAEYTKILTAMPKGVLAAFNINSNSSLSMISFLTSKHFAFVWVLMIILLMVSYGTFAISKEIETRTMGFLLSQPISRMKLYLSRYIAGVIGLIFFILMSETITWPLVRLFGDSVYWSDIFKVGLLGFMLGLFVLGLTMMISSFTSESSKTTTYAGGILIIMYVLFLISSLESKLRNLKYLSLFHYYDPANIIGSDRIGSSVIISLLVFSLVTCVIGLLRFVNRDVAV